MSANILTSVERAKLNEIPFEINDLELSRFFILSHEELAAIDSREDAQYRLDQAAHFCVLRWLGWSPVTIHQLPEEATSILCQQLRLEPLVGIWQPPAERTSRIHAERARKLLGWSKYNDTAEQSLVVWLAELAEEQDQGSVLFEALCKHLYDLRIVRPGLARLERLVEVTRNTIRDRISVLINSHLSLLQKEKLDGLLVVQQGELLSPLQRLKETPKRASGNELLIVIERIAVIRSFGLTDLKLSDLGIHPNRIKVLARRAKQRTNWFAAQLRPAYRYLLLVCFLDQALHEYVDLAMLIYLETIHSIFQRATTKRDKEVLEQGQRMNDKVLILSRLAKIILDENGIPDAELRQAIFRLVPRDRLAHTVHECDEIAHPADFNPVTFAVRSYSYLRHFAPGFLSTLQFQSEEKDHPLLQAINFMHKVDLGETLFKEPPLDFVPFRWKNYIMDEKKNIHRAMYELCLHDCLAKAIEHGQLWIPDSQNYTSFKGDWIPDPQWPDAKTSFLAEFPELANVDTFLQKAQNGLDDQMAQANQLWPDLQDEVWIENEAVHLTRLEARELPVGVARLQEWLTALFPRIGIAQLLLEVNHWTGIDRSLISLNQQDKPVENLTAKKIAVLMAEGMNIGLQNLSYCVKGMSYADLAGVYDRYFREDTLRQAIVAVVNFYNKLPITRFWGDGTASSSDGQIFGVPVKTVHSQYHPELPSRSGRALSLYTHVSDHGIPFYGQVIHRISQEGAYVLDGLLHHETDLTPQHHSVDTGGYQDTLWGACHLLGFSLEPRIRDIAQMRLFRMRRKVDEYGNIHVLFPDPVNTRAIRENWDSLLRLMASIQTGIVPASRILRKLDAYHVESGVYKALREIGRIAKTSFLLNYYTQKELRQQVQTRLNRVESYHALAKSIFFAQAGEFRLAEMDAQINRASCLQLLVAMVMTWNAAYLSAAVEKLKGEGMSISPEQMTYVLPAMSEHINRTRSI